MGIVIEHEVGSGVKKAQQKVVQKELSADDTERSKGAWSYGEVTQPRSHFVKERLIYKTIIPGTVGETVLVRFQVTATGDVMHSRGQQSACCGCFFLYSPSVPGPASM
jgi:hypothetical protein